MRDREIGGVPTCNGGQGGGNKKALHNSSPEDQVKVLVKKYSETDLAFLLSTAKKCMVRPLFARPIAFDINSLP